MRFVTVKDEKFDNCVRLVHLRDRDWKPEDITETLLKDLFEDWETANNALDDKFIQALDKKAFSL